MDKACFGGRGKGWRAACVFGWPLVVAGSALAQGQETRAQLRSEATALAPLIKSPFAKRFVQAAERLPPVAPRTLYVQRETRKYLTAAKANLLADADRKALREVRVDDNLYYLGRYGSPLAYSRPIDIVALAGGLATERPRILDFGYGAIGHVEMLAQLGADVVGVDVDPILPLMYAEAFSDLVKRQGTAGAVRLLDGRFPSNAAIRRAVGGGFDLFISKNTLKNGYVHPAQPVDKRFTIDLGVPDAEFVTAMHDVLKPGGFAIVYNLCPAPAAPGKPYIPWADGRCPFPKAMLEGAGFEVLSFDVDDATAAHAMARALGWDRPPQGMKLKDDLFVWYTLLRRRP